MILSIVSTSTTPLNVPVVAVMPALKVAAPATLPSIVKNVVSALPSVPLNIISVSLPCASIVILPAVVVRLIAASPAEYHQEQLETSVKDRTPEPFVTIA